MGDTVSLKLVAGRVVTVDAVVRARVGPWLTVQIDERDEIRELIADGIDSWRDAVEAFGLNARPNPADEAEAPAPPHVEPRPSPSPADGASVADAAASQGTESRPAHSGPLSNPALAVGPQSSASVPRATRPLPEPSDPGEPPEPPRLVGDRVLFRHAADLRKEVDADLRNGGLFVNSEPLPLRTKRRLTLVVGDIELPGELDVDVVFSSGGKVGFSVAEADKVCAELRQLLAEGVPGDGPETADGEAAIATGDVPAEQTGSLGPPPPVERLLDLEASRTGDLELLAEPSALSLFDELVSSQFKGILRLTGGDAERKVYFHEGNVAFLESSPFEELTSLGRILAQHRRISESALRTALEKARRAQSPLGRSLISLGFARSGDVVSALREQTRSRIEQSFGWPTGGFALSPWENPPGSGELVVTRGVGILSHYLRRRFEQMAVAELEALLYPVMEAIPRRTQALDKVAGPLGLQAKELRFLQVSIDGQRTLEEAVRLSPVSKLTSLRLAAVALSLGLVRTESMGPRAARRGSTRDKSAKLRAELQTKLEQLNQQNHFDVIGVHWSSHPRTFPAAFQAALAELGAGHGQLEGAPEDVQELASRCADRLKNAFDLLSKEEQRVAYRQQLFDKTEREYAAEMLVGKGEVALMRGDRVTAIEHLECAVELAPSERKRRLLRAAREGQQ